MNSLDFLYWALGIGFIVLVIFISVAIVYVIRILRDASEVTAVTRKTVESLDKNVAQIAEKVTSTADQISNYIVKPFNMSQHLFEWFKPVLDRFKDRIIDGAGHGHDDGEPETKSKRRRPFRRGSRK